MPLFLSLLRRWMFDGTKTNGGADTDLDYGSGGSPLSAAKSNPLPPRGSPHLANAMWACGAMRSFMLQGNCSFSLCYLFFTAPCASGALLPLFLSLLRRCMFDEPQTDGGADTNLDYGCGGSPLRRWLFDEPQTNGGAGTNLDFGSGGSPLTMGAASRCRRLPARKIKVFRPFS